MNERERLLIDGLINKEDKKLHNRCITLLFHGQDVAKGNERALYRKNEYVTALENAVRTCFSGRYYKGRFDETYMVFESLFVPYLEHLASEKLREIDNLKNWLFIAAVRFCNSNRNKVNMLLGIDTATESDPFDDGKRNESDPDSETQGQATSIDMDANPTDSIDGDEDLAAEVPDAQDDSSDWAETLLNHYINQVGNAYYRDLIRAIKLEDVAVETIAEEYGKKPADIHRDYSRAWEKLLQICLPDIKVRSKKLFREREADLDIRQADVLNKFYSSGHDMASLAKTEGMKQDVLEDSIIKAYKALLKTNKRETKIDEKEQREDLREQRRLEKEKNSKKKQRTQVVENDGTTCL